MIKCGVYQTNGFKWYIRVISWGAYQKKGKHERTSFLLFVVSTGNWTLSGSLTPTIAKALVSNLARPPLEKMECSMQTLQNPVNPSNLLNVGDIKDLEGITLREYA